MNEAKNLKLVVATFPDETGAARALATIVPGVGPERIGHAGHSALVATIDLEDVEKAERLLDAAGAVNMAVKEVDAPLVAALDAHAGGR